MLYSFTIFDVLRLTCEYEGTCNAATVSFRLAVAFKLLVDVVVCYGIVADVGVTPFIYGGCAQMMRIIRFARSDDNNDNDSPRTVRFCFRSPSLADNDCVSCGCRPDGLSLSSHHTTECAANLHPPEFFFLVSSAGPPHSVTAVVSTALASAQPAHDVDHQLGRTRRCGGVRWFIEKSLRKQYMRSSVGRIAFREGRWLPFCGCTRRNGV